MSCQRIKLVGKRHAGAAFPHEMAFANNVHEFASCQDSLRRAKRLEAAHRPDYALNGTVILLHEIVEVFDLRDFDWEFSLRFSCSSAALLAPLLSIVTVLDTSLCRMALLKKRLADDASRFAVNKKSTVLCLACLPRDRDISRGLWP